MRCMFATLLLKHVKQGMVHQATRPSTTDMPQYAHPPIASALLRAIKGKTQQAEAE